MPERIAITDTDCVHKAVAVLRAGGVILYPTDTLYGLGADALNPDALEKIYSIKGRDEGKPLHSIVPDMETASLFGEVNDSARKLAEAFLPGALTLLLAKKDTVPDFATAGYATFGIRIPDSDFCLELARLFGKPFTATSANRSGETPERTVDAILAQLGEGGEMIDLVIDAGELPEKKPSTIVDVSSGKATLVREGAISREVLQDFLS